MCLNKAQLQTVRNAFDWWRLVPLYLFSICHWVYPSTVSVCVAYLHMAKSLNNCFNNAFVHVMEHCPRVLKRLHSSFPGFITSWLHDLLPHFLVFKLENILVLTLTVAFRCNINVTELRTVLFITVMWQYLPIFMASNCSFSIPVSFQTCCFI